LGLECLEGRLAPATLTVNSSLDTANPSDSYLTLREAVAIVNSPTLPPNLSPQILAQISDPLHANGADTIQFSPGVTAITLGGTQLDLNLPSTTAQVTVDGGTTGVTVNGNSASRVLLVDTGVQATLVHLTLTHGKAFGSGLAGYGGGISSSGTLTLNNCTVSSSSAGVYAAGIYNAGTMTVSNSTITGNTALMGSGSSTTGDAGGVYNSGTLTVNNSTVSSNSAGHGSCGGIDNTGTLTVNDSSITGNTARWSPTIGVTLGSSGGVGNSGTATLNHTTISNNFAWAAAGGLGNSGTVTVTGCTFASNSAAYNGGGIVNTGMMAITGSTFSQNGVARVGGAITNEGRMTLTDSTLDSNTADDLSGTGGGIDNAGTLTVANCTLRANSAMGNGGGISNGGTLTIQNSTLVSNVGNATSVPGHGIGGGIANINGTLSVLSSTLSSNSIWYPSGGSGGGIGNSGTGTVLLRNTIVAGNDNRVTLGPDVYGTVDSASSYNLVGAGDSSLTGISNGVNHNQVGTVATPINPLLGPLADNGGPTQTRALMAGSPAIGAGDPALAGTLDQRGVPRPSRPSIGAYQASILVTTLADTGVGSLRAALGLAGDDYVITFAPAVLGTITLTSGELQVHHNVTIVGPGSGQLSVSGGGASRVLEMFAGTTVSVSGLTLTGGFADSGGGVRNAGTLTLTDCSITNNQASISLDGTGTETPLAQGGGLYSSGSLTLIRCTVSGNSATLTAGNLYAGNANGGGLYANGATVTLVNSTVSGNSATGTYTGGDGVVFAYGGGLTSDNGTLTLSGCTVSGNTVTGGNSAGFGGGVHSYQSTVTLSNCTIAGNTASSAGDAGYGGGVSGLNTSMSLVDCTVTRNSANTLSSTGSGGGLYYNSSVGSAQVLNSIVAGNSSATDSPDVSGSFSSLGYNLIGIADGSSGWGGSDQTGTAASPLDPMLGTLGNHGGPTQTIPLLAGSPALNAGDPGQLGVADQRGVVRTGGINIGAFQASAASFVLSAPSTVTAGVPFDVSVVVVDSFGQVAVGYGGTIHFSSTDGDPGVVLPADYTFQPSDGGIVLFSGGVTLFTPGSQTLTVTDFGSGITASVVVSL
jgi:hypothetical protein